MKSGTYGISSVTLTNPGVNGAYPASWMGADAFSFKAIVKDSLSFNDSAAGDNDIEVEDSDDIYASLQSGADTRGFTMDTYDMSEEAYLAIMQYTKPAENNEDGWVCAPAQATDLIKAVQIVTRQFDDFPSKTFQWAKMKISVTRAGTIGKSGFPNLHLEFRELMNSDAQGRPISGHRWKLTTAITYSEVDSSETGYSSKNPANEGWFEKNADNQYRLTWDTAVVNGKTYYTVDAES